MTDEVTARMRALDVASLAPLAPPAGLDLSRSWYITAGAVTRTVHDRTENEINSARLDAGLLVTVEDIARETTVVTVACPACGDTDRLAFVGSWGSPADLSCGCGYLRRPYPDSPRWGIRAMMDAITKAVENQKRS
ncbi:hypothetical protein NW249_23825 [Streptomyces sp. OUCMDZ-4982]|uniref:hypothetical protein n=1 Tax=Streptomyces sp. OUCMDZ-4982 TaxID=2973090 RepID=UPI00215D0929|nr:hypothetical protein [Streptomyces sp. OUCMDZ-4982]MCR8945150.1 hypothetical protein [Streptomyces sp. OUCMDZ-4982]